LREQGLEFFLQVDARQLQGWDKPRPVERKRTLWHVRDGQPRPESLIHLWAEHTHKNWQRCSWPAADGQTRHTRLGWMEVYLPGSLERGADHLERLWLVVDWPEGDPEAYHYYLAHLHRPPKKALCLRLSRSHWQIEQYFQRAKTDLGLDHFEKAGLKTSCLVY
jgi:hypothetical protein